MNKNTISYIVAGGCLAFALASHNKNQNLKALLELTHAESRIAQAQILDLASQMSVVKSNEYQKGFEAGKTQMGIAYMNKEQMLNYADGYHAATSQFSGTQEPKVEKLVSAKD
jgi:hypothetical protein